MHLGRCFRFSHNFLPLLAAGALAACSGETNTFGQPFTLSASDAGPKQSLGSAGKSGASASAGRAAGGSGGQAASAGRGSSASADNDAGADDGHGDDSRHSAGNGGSGGAGGTGGSAGSAGHAAGSGGAGGSVAAAVSFGDIFSGTIALGCSCHNDGAGGLDLSTRAAAYKNLVSVASGSCSGEMRVAPGKPDASVLFHAVSHTALGSCRVPNMPQGAPMLSQAKLDQIQAWIAAGALATERNTIVGVRCHSPPTVRG